MRQDGLVGPQDVRGSGPKGGILNHGFPSPEEAGVPEEVPRMVSYRLKVVMAAALSCVAYGLVATNWAAIRQLFATPW